MSPVFQHRSGELPLLISVPHDGRDIPVDIRERMSDAGARLVDARGATRVYEVMKNAGGTGNRGPANGGRWL